jgi:hypothetical protein
MSTFCTLIRKNSSTYVIWCIKYFVERVCILILSINIFPWDLWYTEALSDVKGMNLCSFFFEIFPCLIVKKFFIVLFDIKKKERERTEYKLSSVYFYIWSSKKREKEKHIFFCDDLQIIEIHSDWLLKRNDDVLIRKEQKTELFFSPNVSRDPLWLSTINTYTYWYI